MPLVPHAEAGGWPFASVLTGDRSNGVPNRIAYQDVPAGAEPRKHPHRVWALNTADRRRVKHRTIPPR